MNVYYESTYEKAFVELLRQSGWTPAFGPTLHRRFTDAILEDDLRAYLRGRYADKGLSEDETDAIVARIANVSGGTPYQAMVNAVTLAREGFDFRPAARVGPVPGGHGLPGGPVPGGHGLPDGGHGLPDGSHGLPVRDLQQVARDLRARDYQPFRLEYIDFDHPERNIFRCVNQFEFHQGAKTRIPDIVLFVNGIPLVIIELKNPMDRHATVKTAHGQITLRYQSDIPALMKHCALAVISDGSNTRLGTSVSAFEYFYAWKKVENEDQPGEGVEELKSLVAGALKPERLLEIFRDYLYFPDVDVGQNPRPEVAGYRRGAGYRSTPVPGGHGPVPGGHGLPDGGHGLPDGGHGLPGRDLQQVARDLRAREIAVVCRYPQFFAARKLKARILAALRSGGGNGRGGLYFGATGCGKTYTMLFLSRLLALRCRDRLGSPTILLIVDREDLESQAGRLFCNSRSYLQDNAVRVFESREELSRELKARRTGGFYITTIQKFTEATGILSDRENIICMSDEAHRTQNNLGSRLKADETGVSISYGFAKHLRDALPNATYCGFTGTPIDAAVAVFGGVVDEYTMRQAQADGITVPIVYDPRLARVFLDKAQAEEVERYYRRCEREGVTAADVVASKKAMSNMQMILGDPDRLERVARDIVEDYGKRQEESAQVAKAMVTCSDRAAAYGLYQAIRRLRPGWCEGEVPFVGIVATRTERDPKEMFVLLGDAEHRAAMADAFKDEKSNFRLAIVVDMWITGFDCPALTFLYNDKPLQRHTLIQTISRVNRRFGEKKCGVIIDYIGIRENMKAAIKEYGGGDGAGGGGRDVEGAHKILLTELRILRDLMSGLDFTPFFAGSALEKLQFLHVAAEYVLARTVEGAAGTEAAASFRTRFAEHVRRLRAAYAICNPAGVLTDDETAWSQCLMGIHSYLAKMLRPERQTEEMNRAVEKMVAEALGCTGVEAVLGREEGEGEFIFGEAFMKELDAVKMPNTKFQLLVRLLRRVIRDYKRTNKVRAEHFESMLAETVEEYNTRDKLTFANTVANDTVNAVSSVVNRRIEELSGRLLDLLKGVDTDKRAFKALGITFEEKAFYDILVSVRDTHKFAYPDGKCKTLAKKIKELVDGTSVYADWLNNDNLKNQLATDLTTLLYEEGYPPEWDEEVFNRVLEQMENYKRNR